MTINVGIWTECEGYILCVLMSLYIVSTRYLYFGFRAHLSIVRPAKIIQSASKLFRNIYWVKFACIKGNSKIVRALKKKRRVP